MEERDESELPPGLWFGGRAGASLKTVKSAEEGGDQGIQLSGRAHA